MNLEGWERSTLGRYGFSVVAVAFGGGATLMIPSIGSDRPFLLFLFGAVVASGWFGGVGPGWLAVLLATLGIDFFYIPPLYAISGNVQDLPWLLAFTFCSAIGNVLGSRYRAMEREVREAHERLRAFENQSEQ